MIAKRIDKFTGMGVVNDEIPSDVIEGEIQPGNGGSGEDDQKDAEGGNDTEVQVVNK
jgi:hypothetical protein